MTSRRTLLAAVGATLLVATNRANAQAGNRRVAFLAIGTPGPAERRVGSLLRSGLHELGWIEGSNLIVDESWDHGDATGWARQTSELLALQPDVFVATTDFMLGPAAAATKTVPIVFIVGTNPVSRGLVKSLANPGGNVTGLATLDGELYPKRLALLKEAVPSLKVVGVFVSSQDRMGLAFLEDARRTLGLELVPALVDRPVDIEPAFEKFAKARASGVIDLAASGVIFVERDRTAALAIKHRMAMLGHSAVAESGVLLSYGYDISAQFKRSATIIDRILRGTRPAEIPVEQVNVYELIVNLRTARALGIELPRTLMTQATRVIE